MATNMWEPYIRSTHAYVPDADTKIVFDKFHLAPHLNKAVDNVRKQENRRLMKQGDDTLKGTKYMWLKGKGRLDRSSCLNFGQLRDRSLKTARAWAISHPIAHFCGYV